jgi:anaerobic ribonucleoside-triphosphate reductase activating protein
MVDVLVYGRFILAKKDITLRYRGSSNQRIIDMHKTREEGKVVLWDETQATT